MGNYFFNHHKIGTPGYFGAPVSGQEPKQIKSPPLSEEQRLDVAHKFAQGWTSAEIRRRLFRDTGHGYHVNTIRRYKNFQGGNT